MLINKDEKLHWGKRKWNRHTVFSCLQTGQLSRRHHTTWLTHLSTLQALYQLPYSIYGAKSFCCGPPGSTGCKQKKETMSQSAEFECLWKSLNSDSVQVKNTHISRTSILQRPPPPPPRGLTLLSSLSSACIQIGLLSSAKWRQDQLDQFTLQCNRADSSRCYGKWHCGINNGSSSSK